MDDERRLIYPSVLNDECTTIIRILFLRNQSVKRRKCLQNLFIFKSLINVSVQEWRENSKILLCFLDPIFLYQLFQSDNVTAVLDHRFSSGNAMRTRCNAILPTRYTRRVGYQKTSIASIQKESTTIQSVPFRASNFFPRLIRDNASEGIRREAILQLRSRWTFQRK